MRKIDKIIIHCSVTRANWMAEHDGKAKVEEIRRWHTEEKSPPWSDIGYHVLIDRDGEILEGRPLERTGAHVRGHNSGSIGVCLIGGHGASAQDQFLEHFTPEQEKALHDLIVHFWATFEDPFTVHGHNEFAAKGCPGFSVREWMADMLLDVATAPQPSPPPSLYAIAAVARARFRRR